MKDEYIVSNEYLAQRGLDLNEYAVEGTYVEPIIYLALDIAISRICLLNDDFKGESYIEKALDDDPSLVNTFYKLQYRVIYNLMFQNETNPMDSLVDSIIVHELGWGKINGYQKGYFFKQN